MDTERRLAFGRRERSALERSSVIADDAVRICALLHERYDLIKKRRRFEYLMHDLPALLVSLRDYFPSSEVDELVMIATMCVLRPRGDDPPLEPFWRSLVTATRERLGSSFEPRERICEGVLAFGCGVWRIPRVEDLGWAGRWAGAQFALADIMLSAMNASNLWLEERVTGYPKGRHEPRNARDTELTPVQCDACRLVGPFIEPEYRLMLPNTDDFLAIDALAETTELRFGERESVLRPGMKLVFSAESEAQLIGPSADLVLVPGVRIVVLARDGETWITATTAGKTRQLRLKPGESATLRGPAEVCLWECSCGGVGCETRHRLDAWVPRLLSLRSFIASAVKGPRSKLLPNSFEQGMYYPLLAADVTEP